MIQGRRPLRVAGLIHKEISSLLSARVRDPRVKGVSISEVEVAADLKRAYVYFQCPEGQESQVTEGLKKAAGFFRRELALRLKLKFTPELVWRHDNPLDKGMAMDKIFDSLKERP